MPRLFLAVLILLLVAARHETQAAMSREEALQLTAAAGLSVSNGQILNPCGHATKTQIRFVDLNSDGNPEAVTLDQDPACYGANPGYQTKVLTRDGAGHWTLIGAALGVFKPLPTRTRGWVDYTVLGAGCQPVWGFNGSGYAVVKACEAAARTITPPAPSAATLPAAPMPAAQMPGGKGPSIDALVKGDKGAERVFLTAYKKALGPFARVAWLVDRDGPGESKAVTVAGKPYFMMAVCKDHDCGDNAMVSLYDPDEGVVFGMLTINRQRRMFGGPPQPVAAELPRLFQTTWPAS